MNATIWINCSRLKRPDAFNFVILLFVLSLAQPCFADDSSAKSPSLYFNKASDIHWKAGPNTWTYNNLLNIQIPNGFYVTDTEGAGIFLKGMNNPVPRNVVGVLSIDSGKWWALLEYTPVGFVKVAHDKQLEPATVLKAIETQQIAAGRPAGEVASLDWNSKPAYDAETHSLEWGLKFSTPSVQVVNDSAILLGRHGVLKITAVYPSSGSAGLPSMKDVARNIRFKTGEAYDDYQDGDQTASVSLADLITDKKTAPQPKPLITRNRVIGAGAAVALCAVVGIFAVTRRRLGRPTKRPAHQNGAANGHAPKNGSAVQVNGVNGKPAVNGNGNGHHVAAANGANGNGARRPRRRDFSYSRFYTNVVMELSSSCPGGWTPVYKKFASPSTANGNGYSDGIANHGTNNGSTVQLPSKAEMDLVSYHSRLIEEQKSLIQQQTALIEQKRRMIEEQNTILKKQFEMIDKQYSMNFEQM